MNDGRRGNTKNKGVTPGGMIGAPVLRPDAIDKVRGEAKYVGDLVFTGMLYGRVIRSTMPHARVRGINLSRVESDPSVACTITARPWRKK